MQAPVYKIDGQPAEPLDLDEALFNLPWRAALVKQVVTVARGNERVIHAKTKDRGEVRGGGKKPWPQKYTGRARHGSIRSPLWAGGGVTFGPTSERNYRRKVNRKMSAKALFMVLTQKLKNQELFIIAEELAFKEPKTKAASELFNNFFKAVQPKFKNDRVLIVTPDTSGSSLRRATRNLPFVQLANPVSLSAILLLRHKYIMVSKIGLMKLVDLRAPVLVKSPAASVKA